MVDFRQPHHFASACLRSRVPALPTCARSLRTNQPSLLTSVTRGIERQRMLLCVAWSRVRYAASVVGETRRMWLSAPMRLRETILGGYLSMRPAHHPSITFLIYHEPQCPVTPPRPPRAPTLNLSLTPLSKPTRRRPGKTSAHILLLPNFNPAILLILYSPFFEGKPPRSINPGVGKKDLQNVSLQSSTFSTRFPPPLAMVLV